MIKVCGTPKIHGAAADETECMHSNAVCVLTAVLPQTDKSYAMSLISQCDMHIYMPRMSVIHNNLHNLVE